MVMENIGIEHMILAAAAKIVAAIWNWTGGLIVAAFSIHSGSLSTSKQVLFAFMVIALVVVAFMTGRHMTGALKEIFWAVSRFLFALINSRVTVPMFAAALVCAWIIVNTNI
jgi:hypothetical protein